MTTPETCKNRIGRSNSRTGFSRRCHRLAAGGDGLCSICRGAKLRSANRVRADLAYYKSFRRGDGHEG